MSNTNSLTDELTGKTGIQTDHGGIGIGDLLVLGLDAVLLIYTAFRSYDFLSTTVPTGFEILGLIGLWAWTSAQLPGRWCGSSAHPQDIRTGYQWLSSSSIWRA